MVLLALCGYGTAATPQASPNPGGSTASANLEAALSSMDRTAVGFHSAQAKFTWISYELVVSDTSEQSGEMFIRKSDKKTDLVASIKTPGQEKYVLVLGDNVTVFQPKINQETIYKPGKNKDTFESFLVLGFGGGGHQLLDQFKVEYGGMEKVDGINTVKLKLTPKSQRVANLFATIELWIDPAKGVSLQQKLTDPSGNYRLAHYTNIEINKKAPEGTFALKTNRDTVRVMPQ
jgi:outer membrane lipoprotein-sorting protein